MVEELTLVKLGGSLITDKGQRATPRPAVISRLAQEMQRARQAQPHLRIVLGHGSGSFGHWEAACYHTNEGVATREDWQGFARVGAAAAQLNRIVADSFLAAGVPVISLPPSASALVHGGTIAHLNTDTLLRALSHGLVPLVFGDVAFDQVQGGTILSTEDIFGYLAQQLHPRRILLLGNAPGVLDSERRIIPQITPQNYPRIQRHLRGSHHTDVTGGMADKVQHMVELVQEVSQLKVWIMTGRQPENLYRALLEPEQTPGTLIHAG